MRYLIAAAAALVVTLAVLALTVWLFQWLEPLWS